MTPLRWAVVGPGRIAKAFVQALRSLPDAELVAVCGRDAARTEAFAREVTPAGIALPDVCTDLATRLARGDIHAVYVATPHSQHAEAVTTALRAGCGVLCEKSLTPDRAQAEPLVALARDRGLFLMEAVWTRFLPAYAQVKRWMDEGAIGSLRGIQSSFCFPLPFDPANRLYDPARAGGALLDVGIYNLTATRWALQQALGHVPEPVAMDVHGELAPSGVDRHVAATLHFRGGLSGGLSGAITSQFMCGFAQRSDNSLRLMGDAGCIVLPHHFWMAQRVELHQGFGPPVVVDTPFACNGLEGEISEAMRCMRAGLVESPAMSLDESLATLGWMDQMRARLGVQYAWE